MVGKSSLTYRFINHETPKEHDPTIEDKYKTNLEVNGSHCEVGNLNNKYLNIEILDTAGQDDYQGMLDMWISFADGILLVFAINDRESFEALERKRDRILKTKGEKFCPIVIVGNKCDLDKDRQVDELTARNLANTWKAGYIETSATVIILNYK